MKVAVAIVAALLVSGSAHAESCMKSGEETRGMGKTCYYRCTFGETTENVGAAQMCPMTSQASPSGGGSRNSGSGFGSGLTCHKTGERETGMTKQCIYDCAGSTKVETIGSARLCPLTTKR